MFSKRSVILISSKKTIPFIPKTSSFSHYSPNQSTIFNRKSLFLNSMSSSSKSPGPIQKHIEAKLRDTLEPAHLEIINDSYKHNVPKGSESHFSVIVVSDKFKELSLLERHRLVNATLADVLADGGGVHALSIKAKTVEQFEKANGKLQHQSPSCMGGDGKDRI